MAVAKFATVTRRRAAGQDAVVLEMSMREPAELGFQGGKYIIVHTGIEVGEGKTHKRPYSILSDDRQQGSFELAVLRIDGCIGSPYMHALAPGDVLQFTGPWGKLWPSDETPADTLVVATDNGITAALGLVNSQALAHRLDRTRLCWLVESDNYFVDESFVKERLPAQLSSFQTVHCARVDDPGRITAAREVLAQFLREGTPERSFLVGDGHILRAIQQDLLAAGVAEEAIVVENFFNRPPK